MADLLTVSHLKKYFSVKGGDEGETTLKAVDDISFSIAEGETLGLVGESGCGKSTVGKCLVRLYEPTDGQIVFQGTDITHLSTRQIRPLRRNIQMIFQDPYSSLDPRMNVKAQISEGMKIQHLYKTKAEREEAVIKLLREVGLSEEQMLRYPHEFSGGQQQRIAIARAIALRPALIVCDEPVSALDVSVQAQVVNLLQKMKAEYHITYLFISHDLRVVKHLSDRIAVMYLGAMMEYAGKQSLFEHPLHPYTQMLLSSVPDTDPERKREKIIMQGEIPGIDNIPQGCRFCTRCPYATERCRTEKPTLREVKPGHSVACFRYEEGKQA